MKKGNYRIVLSIFFLSALLALTGCPDSKEGKVTGGGWIVGSYGGKASFGFNADSCPAAEGTTKIGVGRFNYHDKDAEGYDRGVKMNGWITEVYQCVEGDGDPNGDPCEDSTCDDLGFGYYEFTVEFRSTNPREPGLGKAVVCVWDNGEGAMGDGDHVRIEVLDGAYDGYTHEGDVQGGNIQAHTCDDA